MDNKSHIQQLIKSQERLIEVMQKDLQKLKEMESSSPEPKEPENYSEVVDAMPINDLMQDIISATNPEVIAFCKRLLIADYCGRREFVEGGENYFIERYEGKWQVETYLATEWPATNYFPTKEAAEKYLKICLNSNLL